MSLPGFIAHMDTAPSFSGKDVKPQFIRDYDGQDICLNREQDLWMRTADFPVLKAYEGKDVDYHGWDHAAGSRR